MTPERTLVYLHGFMSSSRSHKASLTRDWMREYYPDTPVMIPDLPHEPAAAIALVDELLITVEKPVFIGSSMGGYYANYFSETTGSRAVLVNPAVYPFELIKDYLGPQQSQWTGEQFTVTPDFIDQLRGLYVDKMAQPQQRWALVQTGDEILDYCEAESYYRASKLTVERGGDHSFTDFDRHLPAIARFLL